MILMVKKCNPLKSEIKVSGDKSITHRGLIIGALAEGKTLLREYSRCADCMATLENLSKLGIKFDESESAVSIHGKGFNGIIEPSDVLDCKNSGTTMRLLVGVLAGQDFFSVLTGDSSLRKRPMSRVIEPLKTMGAEIFARADGRYAPLCIKGGNLKPIDYRLPVASAQVKSAILLACLYTDGTAVIEEPIFTRDHSERMLKIFGAKIERKGRAILIKGREILYGQDITIPGDISSAAYFIVLGSLVQSSEIFLKAIGINPTRTGLLDVLKTMGADISVIKKQIISNEPIADLLVRYKGLRGIEISGELIPRLIDELPIIAVAATQATGVTVVKDAKELRVKETDRIKAIVSELRKMGADIEEKDDGFIAAGPTKLHGVLCSSYSDHRIAMALTIAGLVADGETTIEHAECIDISFPEFIKILRKVSGEDSIRIKN